MAQLTNTIDFKKYKRFFSFGCSFTNHIWPTWADLIANEIPESYNYGQCGSGNQYIFHSLIEANQRHKFNSTDLVIIMWTSSTREDRYVENRWIGDGNIFHQSLYGSEFVDKFACERGYLIRDFSFIAATKILLDSIGCNYDFLSMIPVGMKNEWLNGNKVIDSSDVIEFYDSSISSIKPSVFEIVYDSDWYKYPDSMVAVHYKNENVRLDAHPTPIQHYNYLTKIYSEIHFSTKTIELATEHTKILLSKTITLDNYSFKRNSIHRL